MRILITNDDGINAPGLKTLDAIAAELAGPGGEVWTVAPALEQSGVGHATSHARPTLITQLGDRRYALEGTPADCVLAALYDVMADTPPDLILSGVNRGNNAGQNTLYSGTIGAAMEGALQHIPSIALSQYYGPGNARLDDPFEASAQHGVSVCRKILDAGLWGESGYRLFYNVNFPPLPGADVQGSRIAHQGTRDAPNHGVQPQVSPNGRRFLFIKGVAQDARAPEGSDVAANLDGYVAITPMRADLTAHDILPELSRAFS